MPALPGVSDVPGHANQSHGHRHAHHGEDGHDHRHDNSHAHGAGHHHAHALTGARLRSAFFLTMVILAVEVAGGLLSHSLALLSDAGHVLTDIAALGLAWFATLQAGRPPDARKTYGYHRTGILAALANAVTLIVIVAVIGYEAIDRLRHPAPVTPWLMFAAAAVGIVVNLYIAAGLRHEGDENLNTRAALLHVLGDIGASVGVIVGGLVIMLTGWYAADPLISLCIAVLIARGAWAVLGETVSILMEGTPSGVDVARLVRDVTSIANVTDMHDLHVWSIAGGMTALSAHVLVRDDCSLSACDGLLTRVNALLADKYRIMHTTIQFEYDCCGRHDGTDVYCIPGDTLQGNGSCAHGQRGVVAASK
jgi:cobalt-zinc-cadmium efflux system protein